MKRSAKIVKDLRARKWKVTPMGPFTEAKKGAVAVMVSDTMVSFSKDGAPSVVPMERILKEKAFILPPGASDESLSVEERELREVVLAHAR